MPKYAWGQAVLDFPNTDVRPGPSIIFRDGVQVVEGELGSHIDYVDTDTGEYRVLVTDANGLFVLTLDEQGIKRSMRRAKHLRVVVLDSDPAQGSHDVPSALQPVHSSSDSS